MGAAFKYLGYETKMRIVRDRNPQYGNGRYHGGGRGLLLNGKKLTDHHQNTGLLNNIMRSIGGAGKAQPPLGHFRGDR